MSNINPGVNNSSEIQNDLNALDALNNSLTSQLNNAGQYSLTPDQKTLLVKQIANVQTAKAGLTSTLGNLNNVYSTNLQNNTATLATQTNALSIINTETIDANNQISYINDQKINKMRQVEINNYYSMWYQEQILLLKYLVYYVVVFTILFFLKRNNMLPNQVFGILVVIITLILLFFVIPIVLSMLRRDNMNYNEYDWGFDKKSAPPVQGNINDVKNNVLPSQSPSSVLPGGNGAACIGSACCPIGSVYDTSNNICTIGSSSYNSESNYNLSDVFQDTGKQMSSFWNDSTSYSYSS
jgi:hypothetical protein